MTVDETYSVVERQVEGTGEKVIKKGLPRAEAKAEVDKLRAQRSGQGVYFVMVKDSRIKTLADLNNAGKKLWGAKDNESIQEQADKARDFTTNPAEIEAAAKKAKAAGKSKEDFVAGYSGGAAETASRAWGKDSGIKTLADLNKAGRRFWSGPRSRDRKINTKDSLAQEIADMLVVQGKMTLQQIMEELDSRGWDVNRNQVLVALSAAKARNSGGVWRPE